MSGDAARGAIEESLLRHERQLAEAQRVAHLGSWEWDVGADRVSWSDELYRIFGLEPSELEPTYEGYLGHVHPDDRYLVNGHVEAALGGQDRFEIEHRVLGEGASVVWIHSRGEVVRDQTGAPVQMRGTAHDVTAFKRVEEELRQTSARYRLLQRMASAANGASTVAEALQTAVDEICAHIGWPAGHAYLPAPHDDDLLNSSGIWHLDEPERFEVLRAATAATSFRTGQGVVGGRMADAMPVWVSDVALDPTHVRARATPDLGVRAHLALPVRLGGRTVAVLEFFSTEALEPDQALMDLLVKVAAQLCQVAERQRASAELAAARDGALESTRLKSEVLATMSHEIRTPMNGVIGLTGLLLATQLDDRQRQYADGLRGAGEALLTIIDDILDFSKIEAGKLELEVVDFELVRVVEEAAELVAETARRKGLELVAYCHPELPATVRGDPSRLRQVLLNLTANAIKFTERGEVVLQTRLAEESDEAVVVRFEVADTGIGISQADRLRLFEPFSQADSSTTRRFGGTGLGLAISTRLVAAMGGDIGVDSEPDRGSTFWFTLPFGRPAEGVALPSPSFHHLLEGLRVLVVDDNETNRLILHEQLRAWDMRPDVAGSGSVALERLREAAGRGQPYDLALLDVCMEGMDGVELARRISAYPALAATQLVALTSTAVLSAEDATRAGITARLTKPVHQSQLHDCLMRLAARSPGAEGRTAAAPPGPGAAIRGHVLVVEDNATNQMVAVGILEHLGYTADVAPDGLEALEALARQEYAAVFMDCQMPEMDGYTATGEIRHRQREFRHIPIIAMTAGAIEGDRERCLAAGMDDYIRKPVTPQAVDAVLGRWVGRVTGGEVGSATAARRPPAATTTGGVVDQDRLDVLRGIGPIRGSVLARMVEAFLGEASANMTTIVEAAHGGDASGLCQGAHRLRGAAANLGATELARLCSEMEDLGRTGRLDEASGLLAGLQAELAAASVSLRAAPVPGL